MWRCSERFPCKQLNSDLPESSQWPLVIDQTFCFCFFPCVSRRPTAASFQRIRMNLIMTSRRDVTGMVVYFREIIPIIIIYPDWGMVIYPILWYDKGSSFPVVQLPGLALLTLAAFALRKGIFSWCSEHASQFCDPCSWKVTSPRINHTSATPESTCLYTHNVS